MTSQFDAVFQNAALPILMDQHSDTTQVVMSSPGVADVQLTAIKRASSTEWTDAQDESGRRIRVTRLSLVLDTDGDSGLGVLPDIAARSTFLVDGMMWALDDSEGRGVQGRANLVELHLVRVEATHHTSPRLRRSST